ncbi:hypothetical protein [environmental halophage 1 AAJ-2005]|nr:hypothetical protein [environmental halophage 1 AAJ-2005]
MRDVIIDDWVYAGEIPVLQTTEKTFIWEWRDHSVLVCDTTGVTPLGEIDIIDSYDISNPFKIPIGGLEKQLQKKLFNIYVADSNNSVDALNARFSTKQSLFEVIQQEVGHGENIMTPNVIDTDSDQQTLPIPGVYNEFYHKWSRLEDEQQCREGLGYPWVSKIHDDTETPAIDLICSNKGLMKLCKRSVENFVLAETMLEGTPLTMSRLGSHWRECDLSVLRDPQALTHEEVGATLSAQNTLANMGIIDEVPDADATERFESATRFSDRLRD